MADQYLSTFNRLDKDKDGYWTLPDFKIFLKEFGKSDIDEEKIFACFNTFDRNYDDPATPKISAESFAKHMPKIYACDFYSNGIPTRLKFEGRNATSPVKLADQKNSRPMSVINVSPTRNIPTPLNTNIASGGSSLSPLQPKSMQKATSAAQFTDSKPIIPAHGLKASSSNASDAKVTSKVASSTTLFPNSPLQTSPETKNPNIPPSPQISNQLQTPKPILKIPSQNILHATSSPQSADKQPISRAGSQFTQQQSPSTSPNKDVQKLSPMNIAKSPNLEAKSKSAAELSPRKSPIVIRKAALVKPELADALEVYTLCEKVGEGSYGEIFKAMNKSNNQIVALKIIDLEKTTDSLEDLLLEVDFQAKCDSPYLTQYFGAWMWENKLSIAMEYLGGGTCEDLLADFGVAAQLTSGKQTRKSFVGTPVDLSFMIYMAPEVVCTVEYGYKIDIWSVGILAIELAVGIPPKSELNPMDLIYQIPTTSAPKLPKTFSPEFQEFVSFCLQKSPQQRKSAADLLSHTFITKHAAVDTSCVKKLIDSFRVSKNNVKKALKKENSNTDWWEQYNMSKNSTAELLKDTGASKEAILTVRADFATLDLRQTCKKQQQYKSPFINGDLPADETYSVPVPPLPTTKPALPPSRTRTPELSKTLKEKNNVDLQRAMEKSVPVNVTRFNEAVDDLINEETAFVSRIDKGMEIFVHRWREKKNRSLNNEKLKEIFMYLGNLQAAHIHLLNLVKGEEDRLQRLAKYCANISMIEIAYETYGSHLCSSLWNLYDSLKNVSKFREFVLASAKQESTSILELFESPIKHITTVCEKFADVLSKIGNNNYADENKRLSDLSQKLEQCLTNCCKLLALINCINDVPISLLVKPRQEFVVACKASKVDVSGGSNRTIKSRKPIFLVLLKEVLMVCKVLKDESGNDPIGISNLADLFGFIENPKSQVKKPVYSYKRVILRDFIEVELTEHPKDKQKNLIKMTINVKKGKSNTYEFEDEDTLKVFHDVVQIKND
ncbi:Serine/threonine-protein kinase 25 [Nowakowskiella sp. JEL0407]|nr:Serine/threonine-protein kinase 25 [Nowakowskiella sp. JEL0407]